MGMSLVVRLLAQVVGLSLEGCVNQVISLNWKTKNLVL
jgi:outer membrane lipoprotein SlyB